MSEKQPEIPVIQLEPERKPSFLGSVMSGIGGALKGGLTVGAMGAAAGAALGVIGTALGVTAIPIPDLLGGMTIAGPILGGTVMGAALGSSIGSTYGGLTGVIASRERNDGPSRQEVAQVAFAQGVQLGVQQGVVIGHAVAQQEQQETTHHRDALAASRAGKAPALSAQAAGGFAQALQQEAIAKAQHAAHGRS